MIKAEIICDSIATTRLTTYKLRYPRFIHAEFMTHRMISRNASSSRALPVAKLIEEVKSLNLMAMPTYWGSEKKGMQTGDELEVKERGQAIAVWRDSAWFAAQSAEHMIKIGVHKSIANRLLEPFSHINVVATATEWDNFFGLRLHKDAEPTMRALAVAMWEARAASKPRELKPGEWHLPFISPSEIFLIEQNKEAAELAVKISVARCARVSYESFPKVLDDGTIVPGKRSTVEEDLKLYDRLVGAQPLHASPCEHQATPDELIDATYMFDEKPRFSPNDIDLEPDGVTATGADAMWRYSRQHGNLIGWRQYRKMLPNEAQAPLPENYK